MQAANTISKEILKEEEEINTRKHLAVDTDRVHVEANFAKEKLDSTLKDTDIA